MDKEKKSSTLCFSYIYNNRRYSRLSKYTFLPKLSVCLFKLCLEFESWMGWLQFETLNETNTRYIFWYSLLNKTWMKKNKAIRKWDSIFTHKKALRSWLVHTLEEKKGEVGNVPRFSSPDLTIEDYNFFLKR